MIVAKVIYEDSRGPTNDFGPHKLVLACVSDRKGIDRWALGSRIQAIPTNGVDRLLRRPELLGGDKARVFVLVDGDEAWRRLGLARDASDEAIVTALGGGEAPRGVTVLVLRDNMETVVEAIVACMDEARLPVAASLRSGKSINRRDRLANGAAAGPLAVRDCVRRRVPAFAALVDGLAACL